MTHHVQSSGTLRDVVHITKTCKPVYVSVLYARVRLNTLIKVFEQQFNVRYRERLHHNDREYVHA